MKKDDQNPTINEEGQRLFRDAMADVKPLKQPQQITYKKSPRPLRPQITDLADTLTPPPIPSLTLEKEDKLFYSVHGISKRTLKRLKQGKIPIEARLDLHGLTEAQAYNAVHQFLQDCVAKHKKVVLIIHGKGQMSERSKPLLKNCVNDWLRTIPSVIAFWSAQPKDGGRGAAYVLLRNVVRELGIK